MSCAQVRFDILIFRHRKNDVLSGNMKMNASLKQICFSVHHKDWLTYSDGTETW